jgi:hypothetical protein
MSKLTDELFNLCVSVVDSHHLDKLFLNLGNKGNSEYFAEYIRDMCDIDKLYVIYDYDIYYQGDVVTEEILKKEQKNALVLPVYSTVEPKDLSAIWECILSNSKSKERVDATLDCLTCRFALIDKQIFNSDFLTYMSIVNKDIVFYPITKEKDILTGIRLMDNHVLIVGDAVQIADFELEMKRFFDAHIMKTL